MKKQAGILCPISSLPSSFGIGDLGSSAYQFVDRLYESHVSIWQILPLNPLGYGNSPYQPLSSYAGDEIYLDVEMMISDGLLNRSEVQPFFQNDNYVKYQEVRKYKDQLYHKAFMRFNKDDAFNTFINDNSWVKEYAIFKVFKEKHNDLPWIEWEKQYKLYCKEQSFSLLPFTNDIEYQIFLQYYFFKQWSSLREYAHNHGIEIIGDMPIYVGLDSADVWMNQENFLLEEDGTPSFVAGVPPDYFSKFGQRWGNPIYNWDYLKEQHFDFWVKRMRAAMNMYDTVRIDHFRAFDTYWKVPSEEPTAIVGSWEEAPGYALFDQLYESIPHLSLLAEDLGDLREEVYELRDYYHLSGMFVFQFHYLDDFDYSKVVVYTGTHDNETLVEWMHGLSDKQIKELKKVLKKYQEKFDYQKIIHYCLDLDSNRVIIPFWDLMGLGEEARFNVPGKIGSPNWEYRLSSFTDLDKCLLYYRDLIDLTHRNGE